MTDPASHAPDVTGSFELHIFVAPLGPDEATAARFDAVCRQTSTPGSPMKGLLLQLDFTHLGFVGVLQSSRYCRGTVEEARAEASSDAARLRAAGFTVLREKVEAVASNGSVGSKPPYSVTRTSAAGTAEPKCTVTALTPAAAACTFLA